ncbi:MAG: single-stranded DNA-binding protein [Anaerovibrio sp.]|uniref:single-stranded DNA-binding protein n=1 Tax=Anaerovibrio TaxID=82373 RepID=UPI0023F42534|nr:MULTISPECIES: single-stranded DNA-binding protein [Anaerovibrio]MBQ2009909.1 single-stranded DNA-binding protein [Selenomonadaceae bacterium]MBQ2411679.1 single-stranded DNA-binding protein [Selenomonadaceae bacterium]MBQ5585819.1 single-stranded DNA-binding protein [Selenomonadaceae bacterium]MBQ5733158.1 single-stranded DNA-binding protein [Selenomonadaceae bacterium]MBQ5845478.1 single-stranded DNA-binding protein [Selenomonadaceae bacterium]
MNKVILKGRLARDVDLRTTPSGKSVAQATIAVDRWGKDQPADFIPLVIWGQQAETFARYLYKGREVLVEGRMQVRSYDDKTGAKRYVTEVIVENFEFCGSKNDAGNAPAAGGFDGGSGFGAPAGGSGAPAGGSGFGTSEGFGQPVDGDIPF